MRKVILTGFVILCGLIARGTNPAGDYISNGSVQDALNKAVARGGGGQQILVSDIGKADVTVGVDYVKHDATPGIRLRDTAKQVASEHDKVTEIYHIMEGRGTLVTGGSIVGIHREPNDTAVALNGPTMRGTTIQGGVSRQLGPGDVVVIPAGVPHWFSGVSDDLKFLIIRVDQDKLIGTK
jgi:mannose-6-phosphate isomerase-like protein (cupin superfamily)